MKTQLKTLAGAIALGFVLLAFGPATSTAQASHLVRQGFRGNFVHRTFVPVRRGFVAGPSSGSQRAFFAPRPFRTVRVFVALPFPHWTYQRVYTSYPGAYCPYSTPFPLAPGGRPRGCPPFFF